ncbi:MAG: hypothetical protein WAW92_01000 [Minisyncoccia bacterium]
MNWLTRSRNKLAPSLCFLISMVSAFIVNVEFRYYQITIDLSEFVFWMSVPAFIFSIIVLFLNENASKSWQKFTAYFMLISVAIILITPNSSHGMDIFSLTRENVTIVLASLYSIVSLILFLYKSIKNS